MSGNQMVQPNAGMPKQSYFINKRVVVTGASSGLGNALAYWYLNHGAQVVLVGKDETALKTTAQ